MIKIKSSKNISVHMYSRGYKGVVIWNDGSKSYYKTINQAKKAVKEDRKK